MKSALALLLGAFVFMGCFALTFALILPFFPETVQEALSTLSNTKDPALLLTYFQLEATPQIIVLFLVAQILQVLIAPIPGQAVALLGGALFGFWQGFLITMLGLSIGSGLAIGLGRYLSEMLKKRKSIQKWLIHYQDLLDQGGVYHFFILFLLPAFPDDALCFLAGMTRLPLKKLWLSAIIGRLPGMAILSYFGANAKTITLPYILILGALSLLVWYFEEPLRHFFEKQIQL